MPHRRMRRLPPWHRLCSTCSMFFAYLRALGRWHTYDVRRNGCLWFGLLWGLPIPALALWFDIVYLEGAGRFLPGLIIDHPIHILFLAHPLLFAVVFGAMGTVRRGLKEEKDALIERLRTLALTDPLTGLHNRRYAMDELGHMLHRARRHERPLAVVLIDIDNFKAVNEELGHLRGDRVLQDVARALKSAVREGDLLARFGGDEFLLVAEADDTGVCALIDRARAEMRERVELTFSAGVALWPGDGCMADGLIGAADERLRKIKRKVHGTEIAARR